MKRVIHKYIPAIFTLYIAINTILSLYGSQLCESQGCNLVKSLTTIEAIYINIAGLVFALIILILSIQLDKNIKYKIFLEYLLYIGFIFESVLIVFQIRLLETICYYCFGVFGFIAILSLYHLNRVKLITTFVTILMAFFLLKFIPYTNVLDNNQTTYLFTSQTCKHCKAVKEYFEVNKIDYKNLDVALAQNQNLLSQFNINSIPTLFIKNSKGIEILNGEKEIIERFESKKNPNQPTSINFNSNEESCNINTICE